jgi:hypothetical protein
MRSTLTFALAITLAGTGPSLGIEFNKDVRPVLSDNCFQCHGPDSGSRKAGLRLDREEDILADREGSRVVVPGKPAESELIRRITSTDPNEVMPPPELHKTITAEQVKVLRQWITEGATWQRHWAFIAPKKLIVPVDDSGWAVNEIDRFVLARLKLEGLKPSPEADRSTLIRRLAFDLNGLPPTPEEVAAFARDRSTAAWEKWIARLQRHPRYGEHRARYWLDAARYADTHGLHLDNYREMWPYRDWVIRAFNENKPFDKFTVEQLAGDLMPGASIEQQVATGFNRCNVTTSEGGAIPDEFLVRYAIDRVNTTGTVWMGLTVGCAQCHDHKFDPVSQREYYQLFAYFNNTTQGGMDGNRPDTPPVVRLHADGRGDQEKKIRAERDGISKQLKDIAKKIDKELEELIKDIPSDTETRWEGEKLHTKNDKDVPDISLPIGIGKPFTLLVHFTMPEKLERVELVNQIDERGPGFRVWADSINEGAELELVGSEGSLRVVQIKAMNPGSSYRICFTYDGHSDPGSIEVWNGTRRTTRNRFPYLEIDQFGGDFANEAKFSFVAPGERVKAASFFDRILSAQEIAAIDKRDTTPALIKAGSKKWDKNKRKQVLNHHLQTHHQEYRALSVKLSEASRKLDYLLRTTPVTHVMAEKKGKAPMANILERGEYDKKRDEVSPGVPAALPALAAGSPTNRLGLAQWLIRRDHPLTARVTVNRIWQEFFGVGLVKTAGDFGVQGEPPSHPELLDWLAVDFMENGWDMKRLVRQIVSSATYRQTARVSPQLVARDPENRLYARGTRFRLDAEAIRDLALYVSGLLDEERGGPGVRPYQPAGLWKTVGYENSNTVQFYRHYGDALYRRSIYTFWKRTSPPPNMTALDAPNREACVVRRERTNTPLQALVLLNDVQFIEAARHLAERVIREKDPVRSMALHVLGRQIDREETKILNNSLAEFTKRFESDHNAAEKLLSQGDKPNQETSSPVKLAALTMLANQLLNLDEAITKN